MILNSFVILTIVIIKVNGLQINRKEYETTHIEENGVSTRIIFTKDLPKYWVAKSVYNKTFLSIGWDTLYLETNSAMDDKEQAFVAGFVEGLETQEAIYDHYFNMFRSACEGQTALCAQLNQYLDTNTQWVKQMVEKHAADDVYWKHVNLFYQQLSGMAEGYNSVAPSEEKLNLTDFMWINFSWDFYDVESALKNETNKALNREGHCSALVKLLPGQSDIFVAHNTWIDYGVMRRIMKRYTLPYKQAVGTSVSFSSYPAIVNSLDDFYITNSGLVVMETTLASNNASMWPLVQPVGQVLVAVRGFVANRLADSGDSWTKIFSQYNSGTFNNQWMVIDMKRFSPGLVKPGLLWVLEQMPGHTHREDQTDVLTREGYWASYNRAFYPDIFKLSGSPLLVEKYGDFFTHDKTARALIFKRDHSKIVDLDSMYKLMRYNDFQNDPLSRCDCQPPYSSELTIAARNDLNPANGTYPYYPLSHRAHGAVDAKVTSFQLSKSLSLLAVCGPTTGENLPPFQWSKSDFSHKPHRGHPDFFNFSQVLFSWPEKDTVY